MNWVSIQEAADLEGIGYDTMQKRCKRECIKSTCVSSENGGRDTVLVDVDSLSHEAKQRYLRRRRYAMNKAERERLADEAPWFTKTDFVWFQNEYKNEYLEKCSLASEIEKYMEQKKLHRKRTTEFTEQFAAEHLGISGKQLRRYVERYEKGCKWAMLYEDEGNFEYFKILALCKKPQKGKGMNLTEEMKQLLRNLWADELYQKNNQAFTLLYEDFEDELKRNNAEYIPSYRTCKRFIDTLEYDHGNVKTLIKNGTVGFRHGCMIKKKRNCAELQVMEMVQADAHTFDCWVAYTKPDGKAIAIRPYLVGMIDMKSRCLVGWGITVQPNAEVIKQVIIHMIYPKKNSPISGVPRCIYIDNGKDFTAQTLTGRNRKQRFDFDSSTKGFYKAVGIEYDKRALPYTPWTKAQIERYFGTVCGQFSKRQASYTGTLTGSTTAAKVQKDINGMLNNGELLTLEAFSASFEKWLNEKYHQHIHDGLKEQGEPNPRPLEVFMNAPRYYKAAPPYEYALSLMGKTEERLVTNVGIQVHGELYTSSELGRYIGEKVLIRYNEADIQYICVYSAENGKAICNAYAYDAAHADADIDDEEMLQHFKNQKKQLKAAKTELMHMRRAYDDVQLPELSDEPARITAIPDDKQFTEEVLSKKSVKKSTKQNALPDDFIRREAAKVYEQLAKLG